ncbi:hypothetical protein ACLESD_04255 [Pyxidicoccus sp. 3LFB2]
MSALRPALALAVLVLLAAPASRAADDVPRTLSFQGRLVRADGTPESTPQDLTFSLYATASGGSPLWQERHPAVTVTNGYYAVVLGSALPLRYELAEGSALYLGVALTGQSELTPRLQMASVPFALRAQDSQRLEGRAAATFASANHGHPTATASAPGFLSAQDKVKLDAPGPTYGDGLSATGTPLTVRVSFPTAGGTNGSARVAARSDHSHPRPSLTCTHRQATGNDSGDSGTSVAWCATTEVLTGGGCTGLDFAAGGAFMPTGLTVESGATSTGGPGYRCRNNGSNAPAPTAYAICCRIP